MKGMAGMRASESDDFFDKIEHDCGLGIAGFVMGAMHAYSSIAEKYGADRDSFSAEYHEAEGLTFLYVGRAVFRVHGMRGVPDLYIEYFAGPGELLEHCDLC